MLDRVKEEAERHQAKAVHRVWVSIGELSGVEGDLLAHAFEIAKKDTVCDKAVLELKRVAVQWTCPKCGLELTGREVLACPGCDAAAHLAQGAELLLERVELEV